VAKDHELINASRRGKGEQEIPFNPASFMKGTQIPSFVLREEFPITVTGATLYNTVIAVNLSQFSQSADFANIFDEYRAIWARVHWDAKSLFYENTATGPQTTKSGFGRAVIDYGDSTALTTASIAVGYDTMKRLCLDARSMYASQSWQVKFEPLPDQEWIPVASQSINFCWWKPVILAADSPITTTSGASVVIELCVQMRGIF